MQKDISQRSVIKVATAAIAPEFALKSELTGTLDAPDGMEHTYADQINNLHPTHNKMATWVSAVNFLDSKHEYSNDLASVVGSRIKQACALFSIEDEYTKLAEFFDAEIKQAHTEVDTVMSMADGGYPITDNLDVKRAESHLLQYAGHYEGTHRREIGCHILKCAEKLDVAVGDRIHKIAGLAMPNVSGLIDLVDDRMHRNEKCAELYPELRKLGQALKTASRIEAVKCINDICDTAVRFDKLAGLTDDYNKRVRLPEDFLYGETVKQAAYSLTRVIDLNNHALDADAMAANLPDTVFASLGDDIVGDLKTAGAIDPEKLLSVIPTLPMPDKQLLFQAISNYDG